MKLANRYLRGIVLVVIFACFFYYLNLSFKNYDKKKHIKSKKLEVLSDKKNVKNLKLEALSLSEKKNIKKRIKELTIYIYNNKPKLYNNPSEKRLDTATISEINTLITDTVLNYVDEELFFKQFVFVFILNKAYNDLLCCNQGYNILDDGVMGKMSTIILKDYNIKTEAIHFFSSDAILRLKDNKNIKKDTLINSFMNKVDSLYSSIINNEETW